jgi:ATP-dependent RNA helicase RhlE
MLDLGFIHALKRIVPMLPRKRQSLFFSATMPKTIAELADRFLTDPVKVAVTPVATTAERVEQQVTFVAQNDKQALLSLMLKTPDLERALVFTRTKHGADRVVKNLAAVGIDSDAIHGNKSQPQRERALGRFRSGQIKVLIATDIAARGIDIEGVSHVFNFELPNVPEQYVHRIGRTARAGAAGLAVSLCADDERAYLRDIEKLTRQKVTQLALPENFQAEAAKMRKSATPIVRREPETRHDHPRGQPSGQPQQQRRRFGRKKPAGVTVRAVGGRG